MTDIVKGLKDGEIYSMRELLRLLQQPDYSVSVPYGPAMQTVRQMLPQSDDVCDELGPGDVILQVGGEPFAQAQLNRVVVYPKNRKFTILVSGSPQVLAQLGSAARTVAPAKSEAGQIKESCHLESFFPDAGKDPAEQVQDALVTWLRQQPCTMELGDGNQVLLTCKEPGIIPSVLRFLSSSLFLEGMSPHIIPCAPPVYCSKDCTVRQAAERMVSPISFLEGTIQELPLILHRLYPEDGIMDADEMEITPRGAFLLQRTITDVVISLLHTLAVLQEQMGVVIYPENLDCLKLQCKPGLGNQTPYYGKREWFNPDRLCYPFALEDNNEDSAVAFEIPYPRFLLKVAFSPNVTAYAFPFDKGTSKATVISALNISSNYIAHQLLASANELASTNKTAQQVTAALRARGVDWDFSTTLRLAKWAKAGYLKPYSVLHRKEEARLRQVGVVPGSGEFYGYDIQKLCYLLAREVNKWNLKAGLASSLLNTGTILDYLNLRHGFQPSISYGPTNAANIWKARPLDILRDLYLRARQPGPTPSLALAGEEPMASRLASEYAYLVNQQPIFSYLGNRLGRCGPSIGTQMLRTHTVMK